MIRIHFTYKHVEKPWGGANNFISALRKQLQASGRYTLVDCDDETFDILFMNQLGSGPSGGGKVFSLAEVRRMKARGCQLVVRAVNLNWHAFRLGPRNLTYGWWRDRQTVGLLNLADLAIFQSEYQLDFFKQAGYRGINYEVIHNGASSQFWVEEVADLSPFDRPIRIVSSTASPRQSKRHDLIAKLSKVDGVEIYHLGAWPNNLDSARVKLLGMQPREKMTEVMSMCHYFLHTAIKDPCPNAIFEAIYSGLPVIYNPAPGSSAEIVGSCGFALDEKDLAKTVETARRRLDELRAMVIGSREYYGITRAANQYIDAFTRVANTSSASK